MQQSPCCPPNVFSLFQGDAVQMNLQIAQAPSGLPLDLTSVADINIQLPLTAGGTTALKLSLSQVVVQSPANWGQFYVPAVAIGAISSQLMVGAFQDFAVTFTFASGPVTVRYQQALTVNQVT